MRPFEYHTKILYLHIINKDTHTENSGFSLLLCSFA